MTDTITVYGQPRCFPCKAAQSSLGRQGIPYKYVDISEDPEAAERLRQNGFRSTPVIAFRGSMHTIADLPDITRQYKEAQSE